MQINKVMIAGMDNKVSIVELEKLKEEFPFVEWGVLFSQPKAGTNRYPDHVWIQEFCNSNTGDMSAHFCGVYAREILEKGIFDGAENLQSNFTAVQLNYNFGRSKNWKRNNLDTFIEEYDRDIILQYNKSNEFLLNLLPHNDKVRMLYDASGGRGTEITGIYNPVKQFYTGYAGGINVDNVDKICTNINLHPHNNEVWIDLESGARNQFNEFDLELVKRILSKTQKYI